MQKITPFLWFDGKAEEAAKFYASIFKNSNIGKITRYGKEGYEVHRRPAGTVMTVEFQIDGQKFVALNGGPEFKFTEAVSFAVGCKSQEEVDMFWEKLGEGGEEIRIVVNCKSMRHRTGVYHRPETGPLAPVVNRMASRSFDQP